MKCKRFTEEQIIGILKDHELAAKTPDLCRKHVISLAGWSCVGSQTAEGALTTTELHEA